VVVIGVPDPQWSEAIKAVCVRRAGAEPTADEIVGFVAEQIARYKKPKHVVFVDQLPKNDKGAIDRASVKSTHGGG
jgi:acyl-CoA synthetase (AMP-forming)/AMP-acid ligase II